MTKAATKRKAAPKAKRQPSRKSGRSNALTQGQQRPADVPAFLRNGAKASDAPSEGQLARIAEWNQAQSTHRVHGVQLNVCCAQERVAWSPGAPGVSYVDGPLTDSTSTPARCAYCGATDAQGHYETCPERCVASAPLGLATLLVGIVIGAACALVIVGLAVWAL